MRLVHLSDIHFWRLSVNPLKLFGKRAVGMASLALGRSKAFRLDRVPDLVEKVRSLEPDHVLITGDLTTTSLLEEFAEAREGLAGILESYERATVIPGNHDRYTRRSVRLRLFERFFGEFAPRIAYPWIKPLDEDTAILALDPTRPHLSATGLLPAEQLAEARELLARTRDAFGRLIVACHYPIVSPYLHELELAQKRLINHRELRALLERAGPHLYCCGHVHATWAYAPSDWPEHLSLDSGAPIRDDPTGVRPPSFLEIILEGRGVSVTQHAKFGDDWIARPLMNDPGFFPAA